MRISRAAVVGLLVLAMVTLASPAASAALDAACEFAAGKKLVTLKLPADDFDEGPFLVGRVPGSQRIGFDTDDLPQWKRCSTATTNNTDRIKVVGTQHNESLIVTLEGGMLGPGASSEKDGASEIEISGDLGDGTDTLILVGSNGSDRLAIHSSSSASFNGDQDADISLSGVNDWRMYGGRGNDVLDGHGAPAVDAYGQEGDDRVVGGRGSDDLYGDEGEEAADGDDVLVGGAADDDLNGGNGSDRLVGQDGDDALNGDGGRDELNGGAGDDYMYAEPSPDGADEFNGGPGIDRAWYEYRSTPLRLSLDGRPNDGAKGEGDTLGRDVENVTGGAKADLIVGSRARNSLDGGLGNDTLKGLGDDDSLSGGEGDDSVYGGDGDEGLYNNAGSDKFFGEGGDDYLYAGSADDGRDIFSGGTGRDSIDYSGRVAPITIDVANDNGDGQAGENDFVKPDFERYYGGAASDVMVGGPTAEQLFGNAGDDDISGGRGSDYLRGGADADDLTGGEGYDDVAGEAGSDTLRLVDGAYDYGDCGSEVDTVLADVGVDSTPNCP